jgi:16S rRNA (cytosine967-C5)-methyltransferase
VERIIRSWKPGESLSRHLAEHFSQHRNMGARDRRECRAWVYAWARLGRSLEQLPFGQRLAIACYLVAEEPYPALEGLLVSEWPGTGPPDVQAPLPEKIKVVKACCPDFALEDVFPSVERISPSIDRVAYLQGLFRPPDLWVRVRRERKEQVLAELVSRAIPFQADPEFPFALRLPNRTGIDALESAKSHWLEVQDRSSQATATLFRPRSGERWWDACAGSGGKSLLLLDQQADIDLTVSDRRLSILNNLRQRFQASGLRLPYLHCCDLGAATTDEPVGTFDVILADVPCSGSGTWTRKPEGLFTRADQAFFQRFQDLQRNIVRHLTPKLKPGGRLIYLTCSVFSQENEKMAAWVQEEFSLKLEEIRYFEGAAYRADTLFGVSFVKR